MCKWPLSPPLHTIHGQYWSLTVRRWMAGDNWQDMTQCPVKEQQWPLIITYTEIQIHSSLMGIASFHNKTMLLFLVLVYQIGTLQMQKTLLWRIDSGYCFCLPNRYLICKRSLLQWRKTSLEAYQLGTLHRTLPNLPIILIIHINSAVFPFFIFS